MVTYFFLTRPRSSRGRPRSSRKRSRRTAPFSSDAGGHSGVAPLPRSRKLRDRSMSASTSSSKPRSRLRRAGLLALLVAAAFSAGMIFALPSQAGRFNPYQKLGVFTKVLSYIEAHYVEDIAETDLMY